MTQRRGGELMAGDDPFGGNNCRQLCRARFRISGPLGRRRARQRARLFRSPRQSDDLSHHRSLGDRQDHRERRHGRLGRDVWHRRAAGSAVAIISDVLAPLLVGREPVDIPAIWDELYALMRVRGHWSGFSPTRLPRVDIALWDLAGKLARTIGGRYARRRAPATAFRRTRRVSTRDVAPSASPWRRSWWR